MPHHKDAIKRMKQGRVRRLRNRHYRTRMRNQIKAVRTAVAEGDTEKANASLREAMSAIHRCAGKGVIHPNQAARRIHRLNKRVKALATASE